MFALKESDDFYESPPYFFHAFLLQTLKPRQQSTSVVGFWHAGLIAENETRPL